MINLGLHAVRWKRLLGGRLLEAWSWPASVRHGGLDAGEDEKECEAKNGLGGTRRTAPSRRSDRPRDLLNDDEEDVYRAGRVDENPPSKRWSDPLDNHEAERDEEEPDPDEVRPVVSAEAPQHDEDEGRVDERPENVRPPAPAAAATDDPRWPLSRTRARCSSQRFALQRRRTQPP